ncbi:anchored repeat ABC transporter, substrate-binding protein [Corynebacterium sp. 22_2729]
MERHDSSRRGAAKSLCANVSAALLATGLAGCAVAGGESLPSREDGITDVVASTPIIADIARHVAGDSARVTSLIPNTADPHSYELTLRDVRNLANADIAFNNGLLLEQQSVLRTMDNGVLPGVEVVSLADVAANQGATVIPLVENMALDTVWLGIRAQGIGAKHGGSAHSEMHLSVTDVKGPGDSAAYITGTFGQPEVFFNSRDGFDASRGYEGDTATLPVDAHTHMSWSFSKPGTYTLHLRASLVPDEGKPPQHIADQTVQFNVGTDDGASKKIDSGHYDISVNADENSINLVGDGGTFDPKKAVVNVPNQTLQPIPGDPTFRFLGNAGDETYLLPQAVLGKHVHGELDPHLWHNAKNAMAYVKVIRDKLITVDPDHAADYQENAQNYLDQLDGLDREIKGKIRTVPEHRRHLVTAHDGYAYFADAYGLDVAGFVTPNPEIEPSTRDLVSLTRTLENLKVPAVFIEPTMAGRTRELQQIADRLGVSVCQIRSDTLDDKAPTYVDLMRTNAESMADCLSSA